MANILLDLLFGNSEHGVMMTLSKYHAKTGISQAEMARKLGVSRSYYSELVSGPKTPGGKLAAKIERETGGMVLAVSFYPAKTSAA